MSSGAIKGYPTSQKLVKGQPLLTEFATMQPADAGLRAFIDTNRFAFRVDSDTVARTAGVGTGNPDTGYATVIVDTATPARVGDFVRFIDGPGAYLEIAIVAVTTNNFTLASRIPAPFTPVAGNEFFIMRYATQRVDESGSQIIVVVPPTPAEPVDFESLVVSGANITTGGYTTLTASLAGTATEIEVNNSTGKTLILALGVAASEVNQLLVFPSGLSRQPLLIPAGTRVSLRAANANATVGEVNINYFG